MTDDSALPPVTPQHPACGACGDETTSDGYAFTFHWTGCEPVVIGGGA